MESVLERSKLRVFEAVSELLDDGDSEVRIAAGIALATLWEYADAEAPGSEYTVSGMALCENPGTVSQAVASLQRIGSNINILLNVSAGLSSTQLLIHQSLTHLHFLLP